MMEVLPSLRDLFFIDFDVLLKFSKLVLGRTVEKQKYFFRKILMKKESRKVSNSINLEI